jgi:peroxiredoxin
MRLTWLLLLAAAGCASNQRDAATPRTSAAAPEMTTGAQAPDFTLPALDGSSFQLRSYLGKKVIVLSFFATWCEECFVELPHLQVVYDQHKKDDLLVVGVSMDGPESSADVGPFIRRHALTMPIVLDEETRAVSLYNPRRSAPFMVLIDRTGRVVKVREGYVPGDADRVDEDIRAALAAK